MFIKNMENLTPEKKITIGSKLIVIH